MTKADVKNNVNTFADTFTITLTLTPDALLFWTIATSSGWNQLFFAPCLNKIIFFLNKWSDRRSEYEKQRIKASFLMAQIQNYKENTGIPGICHVILLIYTVSDPFPLFSELNLTTLVFHFVTVLIISTWNCLKVRRKILSEVEIVSGLFCSAAWALVQWM